jgi:hypothetical protein
MGTGGINEDVRRFLAINISSIGQLEVLLLLRSTPERGWSAEECSRELRSDFRWIQALLGDLAARGFLSSRDVEAVITYRYAPSTPELQALIDGTEKAYRERRLSVINLIHGKLESDARSFSDAFTIIKKKGG